MFFDSQIKGSRTLKKILMKCYTFSFHLFKGSEDSKTILSIHLNTYQYIFLLTYGNSIYPAATATFVQNPIVEPEQSDQDCSNQVHLITGELGTMHIFFLISLCKTGIWGYCCIDKIYMHDIEKFSYISILDALF